MDWRTGVLSFICVGLTAPFVACDDTALQTDAGTVNPDGGTPVTTALTCPSYMPAGATCGETVPAFGTTISTWSETDPATKKINKISWNLPLTAVANVTGALADTRVWFHFPPQVLADTAITGMVYDYLPKGHVPKGIYDTPHFEFHLIVQDLEETRAIDCADPTLPADNIVIAPFFVLPPPDNCIGAMGIHAVDSTAPEFNKAKFNISNVMVYWHGKGAGATANFRSMEPKATIETFQARQSFKWKDFITLPPNAIGHATTMGTKINADYDKVNDSYVISLSNFVPVT